MSSVASAAAAVRAARRRLLLRAAAEGASRGLGVGVLVGAAVAGAAWAFRVDAALWPLAAPALGAAVGAAMRTARGVPADAAALALDAAAGTDEAFVTAIAARDLSDEIRGLVADYAVRRCPPASVARALPLRAPAVATAALAGAALLAALVLVPRADAPSPRTDDAGARERPSLGGAPEPAGAVVSPADRVQELAAATASGDTAAAALRPAVATDVASVSDDDLRRLAEALAASPSADAARRALDALAKGDRDAAVAALREALGAPRSVAAPDGTGSGTVAAAASASSSSSWGAATWPLRYDHVVRRWLDETAAAEGSTK